MSQWKQFALQKIREGGRNPDSKEFADVRKADTPLRMWLELFDVFAAAHKDPTDNLFIQKIYEYARWCLEDAPRGMGDAGSDPSSAALVCFYEDLPLNKQVRVHIGEYMTVADVAGLRIAFRYHLGDTGVDELLREVSTVRRQFLKSLGNHK